MSGQRGGKERKKGESILGTLSRKDKNGNIILTVEKNMALYNILMKKLQEKPYSNNRWNIYKSMEGSEEAFRTLSMKDQCAVVNQIITWINSSKQTIDLQLVGGKKSAGMMVVNKKIMDNNEFVLIHQSVTGIYESETDLLTV